MRGTKPGIVHRPLVPAEQRLGAQAVPVVEDLGPLVEEADHRCAMLGDARPRRTYSAGSRWPQLGRFRQRQLGRYIGERDRGRSSDR